VDSSDFNPGALFGFWPYALSTALGAVVGLRILAGLKTRRRQEEVVAFFDLLWVLAAMLGVMSTFGQAGAFLWRTAEASDELRQARFVDSVGQISIEGLVQSNCGDRGVQPQHTEFGGSSYQTYADKQPCIWARELVRSKQLLEDAETTIHNSCTRTVRSDMDERLFRPHAGRLFDACGVTNIAGSACGEAYCNKQRFSYDLLLQLNMMPLGATRNASADSVLTKQEAARSSLNRAVYDSLHPFSPLAPLAFLLPLSSLLGVRIAKAVFDYCSKVERNDEATAGRFFLAVCTRIGLYRRLAPLSPSS